jgi:DNA-binding GntR family transcriptional regulator
MVVSDNIFNKEIIGQIKQFDNLSNIVYEAIRESISSGKIAQGTKLKQLALADQLGVSQQTVREALARLVDSGLVIQQPKKGFITKKVSLDDQKDIYKLRAMLEGFAMEEAVEVISEEELERMRKLLPMTAALKDGIPIEAIRLANRKFHMIPVLATKNKHLIRVLKQILDLAMTRYQKEVSQEERENSAKGDFDAHTAILEALKARDGQRARQEMVKHIDETKNYLIKYWAFFYKKENL